ncbi:MAG: sugar ABC transporter permease, partial [Pseudomonadota bacterium]|nr:sugar ABC transporter permease [Pseudomonadota bacterium]
MTDMTAAAVATQGVTGPKVRYKSPTARGRLPVLVLFLPPALLLFTLFVILPMGEAAWYSLYRWNGYGTPTEFVGIRNFTVLFNNGAFSQAL